ncbi:histone acetyltransferase [Blastocystis sp. subtype 4]|uniref:histone acetyltransferase n=1 Tax=Blastocystis sp. subtype 4 TaxID=944170 RepID=UPI0007113003|nr:histone acetyltransferase [Blastocystis sp. subtype 4]KNB42368.1 histone acetyltransferase [Blastocystis sp. subtype 4]|eukprot:XP_014525811.1 histone acetyltransferase [Blastocystis sp. subtype 4]
MAKLFIEHKTIYYDTYPFFFYVLCEEDEEGSHIVMHVGYFSKDKNSQEGYNLACICSLPFVQRTGYGKFLISFSYELSKLENKVGSPEKPLSDLGRISYRSYWTYAIMSTLREAHCSCSVKDISTKTSMKIDDIVSTLDTLGLLRMWKGQYVAMISEEVISEGM